MDNTYPKWICTDCGLKHGKFTQGRIISLNDGKCDVCGKKKPVTEPRDFGYPQFSVDQYLKQE